MLRASSLGPILTLTTYHLPRIWSYHSTIHHFALLGSPSDGIPTRGISSLRGIQRDFGHKDELPARDIQVEEKRIVASDRVANHTVHLVQTLDTSNQIDPQDLVNDYGEQGDNHDSEQLYVQEKLPYPTGRSGHILPTLPLFGGKYWHGDCFLSGDRSQQLHIPSKSTFYVDQDGKEGVDGINILSGSVTREEELYFHFCDVIANTQSVPDAWTAYSTLLTIPAPRTHKRGRPKIPLAHLHRLCRLLARNQPRNRTQFLRLLSILYFIRKFGGKVHLHEWNALISNAGAGWRNTKAEDFQLALDVFADMVSGKPPGTTFSESEYPQLDLPNQEVLPDIYTYNTLVGIASKTLYGRAIQRASLLLQGSGHSPDRITHLSLLAFFTGSKQLPGVRSTLLKMRHQGLELGLDGVNACIWAFGHYARFDVVMALYQILRHSLYPDQPEPELDSLMKLLAEEGIYIAAGMRPNEVTYTSMIQIMAYHGDLTSALRIMMDMLSADDLELGAPMTRGDDGKVKHTTYSPTTAVFRAVFLGFSRHGTSETAPNTEDARAWSLSNLQELYKMFMTLPEPLVPNKTIIYWILVAFGKTSGHDVELMRQVWRELEEKFEGSWGSPTYRLQKLKRLLFSDNVETYLRRHGLCISRTTRPFNDNSRWS